MKKLILMLGLIFVVEVSAAVGDYTYSYWLNGWRKDNTDSSADIFCIETSKYGFTLDLGDFSKVKFGKLSNFVSYEQALQDKAKRLKALPQARLLIELEVDGTKYRAKTCKAGKEKDVKHLSAARMWESGRYVQHYDFIELDFRSAEGKKLPCVAHLDLVAWAESLTFNLEMSPDYLQKDSTDKLLWENAAMRLSLKNEAKSWNQEVTVKGQWKQDEKKSVSLVCNIPPVCKAPSAKITVSTKDGQNFPVSFDERKNCYVALVKNLKRKWKTGYTDIRNYDDFKITVDGSGAKAAVPFLLDMRGTANITGMCPILCDENGRPTGIPVQLSKNWHYEPMGDYLMAYTILPAEKPTTYILRVAYGFYGKLPSASHAQLSLVGYENPSNGRWDQLAIGCWGETICFDMDTSCVDVVITDIRMLMIRNGIKGEKWNWTDAGWGGDWLNIKDDSQEKYYLKELKTAYLSQGPCLTNVKHDGYYGKDREVDFSAHIQTLRTDDYSRVFQKLSYKFTSDVSAKKIWLFKLGRTSHYATPQIAYGNIDGCIEELAVPTTLKKDQLFLDNVKLTGSSPWWVALPGAIHTSGRDWGTGYRALIIRSYETVVGGKTYTNPTISAPVFAANPTNLEIELLPPAGVSKFSKGDSIELDLELITLPRVADDYYGPNEAFRKHLTKNPSSWKTTYREVIGNDLKVKVSGGSKLQNYPLVIRAEKPEVTVTIEGGIGAVPIRFEGLKSTKGYSLYRVVNAKRVKFDQSVHGNDFWQTDYDPKTDSYKMSFNLPLDGLKESKWILTQD